MTPFPAPTIGALKTRSTPTQARAVARVHLILHTAAALLCETSPQNLSTTLIAKAADIPVSSIYRYFPTLDDLLRELYLQVSGDLRGRLFEMLSDDTALTTWRARMNAALETFHNHIAEHPYYRALLLYFLSRRDLVAMDEDEHGEFVDFFSARWKAGLDGFSGGDPMIVAQTVTQIAVSLEDLIAAQAEPKVATDLFEEMRRVLDAYLARYLKD